MSDDTKTYAQVIDGLHDQLMRENRRRVTAFAELTEAQKNWLLETYWAPIAAEQRAAHHTLAVISRLGGKCDLL